MKASDRKKWLSGEYRFDSVIGQDVMIVKNTYDYYWVHLTKADFIWMLTALAKRKAGGK